MEALGGPPEIQLFSNANERSRNSMPALPPVARSRNRHPPRDFVWLAHADCPPSLTAMTRAHINRVIVLHALARRRLSQTFAGRHLASEHVSRSAPVHVWPVPALRRASVA
jgi:hypothetical protein